MMTASRSASLTRLVGLMERNDGIGCADALLWCSFETGVKGDLAVYTERRVYVECHSRRRGVNPAILVSWVQVFLRH